MTEREYLIDQIRMLQREYEKAAKPYVDRLVQIAACNPTPRMVLPAGDLESFRKIVCNPDFARVVDFVNAEVKHPANPHES